MIEFILNENNVNTNSAPNARLLDVLRDEFGLKGPKEGCGEGECGACAVIVDGLLMNSCITPVGNVNGHKVMTLDGFRETKQFKVLEEAYGECGAVQCGFCTPGMIMASQVLLSHNPHPSDAEIREGLSGNLCRCTGYNMIVDAVKMASEKGAGLW
ncbi:MAG: (2Fe-2S)-binding protein [Pseudobutyrivibrio sp.]|nr:(2Fe-2S)-binding protein [Pseudobutyrivibrio sp.]